MKCTFDIQRKFYCFELIFRAVTPSFVGIVKDIMLRSQLPQFSRGLEVSQVHQVFFLRDLGDNLEITALSACPKQTG